MPFWIGKPEAKLTQFYSLGSRCRGFELRAWERRRRCSAPPWNCQLFEALRPDPHSQWIRFGPEPAERPRDPQPAPRAPPSASGGAQLPAARAQRISFGGAQFPTEGAQRVPLRGKQFPAQGEQKYSSEICFRFFNPFYTGAQKWSVFPGEKTGWQQLSAESEETLPQRRKKLSTPSSKSFSIRWAQFSTQSKINRSFYLVNQCKIYFLKGSKRISGQGKKFSIEGE